MSFLLNMLLLVWCTSSTRLPRIATIAFCSPQRRRIHVAAALKDTLYSINDKVCPPTEEQTLRKVVEKHCHSLDVYLDQKPIARHTQEAFDIVKQFVLAHTITTTHLEGIILDSGCGTARSSLLLGRMYPNHLVIGIDRSLVRLWRNVKFRKGNVQDSSLLVDDDGSTLEQGDDKNGNDSSIMVVDNDDGGQVLPAAAVQRASNNVILVRAELSDFWRLCSMEEEWNICRHYLLYPNPYPKKSRLKSRWYAHPAFPILLQLGGCIVVRSNWKGYLEEFATCAEVANECMGFSYHGDGPTRRRQSCNNTTTTTAWTNFEIKYDSVGEPTYELVLTQQQGRASHIFFPR